MDPAYNAYDFSGGSMVTLIVMLALIIIAGWLDSRIAW
jgi:hypothetical protein